jgi:Ser/Thr protein kinase RdoA (MazF antagonist)
MTEDRGLRPDEVAAILAFYPGVGTLRRLEVAGGGTASLNYLVQTTTGRYFLRRRNPRYTAESCVAFDHCLLEYLAARGLPVVPACPVAGDSQGGWLAARECRWLRRRPDEVVELYPWREGWRFDPHNPAQLAAAGRALGRFHAATRRLDGPPGKEWPRYDHPEAIAGGLRSAADLEGAGAQRALLAYLEEQARQLATALPDARYAVLPYTVIHGDYHPANLLFDGDDVAGIFDLDWATRQPRLRDLADGILFFAARRATPIEGGDIASLTQTPWLDAERAALFLEAYAGAAGWPLGPEEEDALPEFVRARWLFCRVDGMRKVLPARRLHFLLDGVASPLQWLAAHVGAFALARGAGA